MSSSSSSRLPQIESTRVPRPTSLPPAPPVWAAAAAGPETEANATGDNSGKRQELAELYKRARDENELLEFKNYELLFKIQELEQNQRKLLGQDEKEEVGEKKQLVKRPPTTKSADDDGGDSPLRQHEPGDDGAAEDAARPGEHPAAGAGAETEHASSPGAPICGSHDIDLVAAGGVDSSSSSSSSPSSSSGCGDVGGRQHDGGELIEYNGGADKAKVAKVEQHNPNQICVGRTPAARHDRRQVEEADEGEGGRANKTKQLASLATSDESSEAAAREKEDGGKTMPVRAKTVQQAPRKSLARSQPDLTSSGGAQQQQPQVRGGARIAVPVARRSISAAQQPPTTGANNRCGTGRPPPPATSHLRARSKSNLDASALARRQPPASVSPQAAGATGKLAATRAPTTPRRQELATNMPRPLIGASCTKVGQLRARSSSSMGFVTQIPTLIGPSHASQLPANNNDNCPSKHQQAAARSRSMSSVVVAGKQPPKDSTAANRGDDDCAKVQQEPGPSLAPETQKPPTAIRAALSLSCVPAAAAAAAASTSLDSKLEVAPEGCGQCKWLEAKLAQAVRDRRLASEQLSELEELENDSRLMSQKLSQQLVQAQQQLELANRELARARDDEAKLQFQNKRLNFELKQRLESIQQLQCQVSRLQTKALVRERAAAASELKVQSATSSDRKEVSPGASSDDGEPAASLSNSDDDSAIDLFEKKRRPSLQSTGDDEEAAKMVDDNRKLGVDGSTSMGADDSAYSKSSASSDDGNGQTQRSLSSSGDESDHHQATAATSLPATETATTALAGRQQVLRKKISTARILRGIQVQQSSLHLTPEAPLAPKLNQARLVPVAGENELGDKAPSTTTPTSKNHADLALEGVKGLEEGRGDHLLRSLTEPVELVRQQQQREEATEASKVMSQQLKQEINSLRQQLIQAHTLNDNLVGKLRSSQDRFAKLETYLNGQQQQQQKQQQQQQQQQQSRASSFLGQQKQVNTSVSPAETNEGAEGLAQAQRSIIYVNGPRASGANGIGNNNNSSRPTSLNIGWLQQHQQQGLSANKNCLGAPYGHQQQVNGAATCCVNLDELLELLRSLLDKIHFHHGRTFELVSECQRLAISALVASHGHQMNMLSHNSVIVAGQQAASSMLAGQQQLEVGSSQTYPVRPPPRRRNRPNMPTEEQLMEQLPAEQEGAAKQVPPTPRPASARASALQVAKQTLFSIVPIYYNSGLNGAKNNKEKAAGSKPVNNTINLNKNQPHLGEAANSSNNNGAGDQQEAMRNKGWILLNQSAPQVNKINHQWLHHTPAAQNQHPLIKPQSGGPSVNNVSVLEINRSQQVYHSTSCSNGQQQSNCYANLQNQHQFTHQQLLRVRHSLSDDIERYRGHFNGQLLDLMTRQNWCESIITEKVKFYQNKQVEFNGHRHDNNNNNINVSQRHLNQHNPKDSVAAKVVYDQTKLVNVPTTINSNSGNNSSISLDPNGMNSQQPQVMVINNHDTTQSQWTTNGGDQLRHRHHQLAQSLC